jgi:hypothetical protein
MITPMRNRSQTIVRGEISFNAILVAMNDAPQTITAKNASKYVNSFELDMQLP